MLTNLSTIVLLGAAAVAAAPAPSLPRDVIRALAGSTIEQSGYATLLDAPPAPYSAVAPAPHPRWTSKQLAGHAQFQRASQFQNRVRAEVEKLSAKLRRLEPRNFVDLYYENEGEPHVVFRFLRAPAATLRKYSRNPAFTAERARYSKQELRAAQDYMFNTFAADRVIQGGGIGSKEGLAVIDINISEPEFRALAAKKGVTIPPAVKLNFWATAPMQLLDERLPPEIARRVRIFPRDNRPVGIVNDINSHAKVVLKDGCFRLSDEGDALVLFPQGAQLFIDAEGYLAFGPADQRGYGRVGEDLVFHGSVAEVTAPELTGPIHKACGPGKVVKVNGTQSAAAANAQRSLEASLEVTRLLRESYGLTSAQAETVAANCARQRGSPICILSPPPPVAKQEDCPAGTKLSFGMCRTPEGYVRPIPEWIAKLL